MPEYQSQKLGEKILKEAQNLAKREAFSAIKWTYDPLEGANANLYVKKLGAVVGKYYEDYYGRLSGKKHEGSATDRFWTELKPDALPQEYKAPMVIVTEKKYADFDKVVQTLPETIAIEVPNDFNALKIKEPLRAQEIRLSTRHVFRNLFDKGYKVRGFYREQEKNFYVAVK